MNNSDVERIVAKIEGVKCGNAFLIDKRRVVTVKHCLPNMEDKVKLVFPKLLDREEFECEATVCERYIPSEDGWILMELEEDIAVVPNITLASYNIQPFDEVRVYGYDVNYLSSGKWTGCQSSASSIINPNLVQDMILDPIPSREIDFAGLSGSPIVKDKYIIGIVAQELLENAKASSIHGISVKSSMEFFSKNDIEVEELPDDITDYKFEANMAIVQERRNDRNVISGFGPEIPKRIQGIYKDKLNDIIKQHQRGDIDGAWELLKNQLIDIDKDPIISVDIKAEYHYRMALWFLEDKDDLIRAKKRCENAKTMNPELDDSIFHALLAFKSGDIQNTEESLEPVNTTAKFNVYLQICINAKRIKKAYDKYLEIEMSIAFDSDAFYLLSVLEILLHKLDDAEKHIKQAIELDKQVPFYHLIKGIISYWKAMPEDMFGAENLYPVSFINGLLYLDSERQIFIKEAISDYRCAYHLAENVENKVQMEFVLEIWLNSLSVDSVFQHEIQEPLQLLKAMDPFNSTLLLYSLRKGISLDEKVTVDSLERQVKKSKDKLGHVFVLVEMCLTEGDKKRAKQLLHEYKALFFNEMQYGYWYEAIVKVEEDPVILREYEEKIKTHEKIDEMQRKRLICLFMQLDNERNDVLERLLNEIYEETKARVDLLNLISFYKANAKWSKMQQCAELLLNKYQDTYGSMFKIQSLIEQQEYEQALNAIEETKTKKIAGTQNELLRNQLYVYERLGKYADAINCGCELVKRRPSAQNIQKLAGLYELSGDESAALNTLLKAEEQDLLTPDICQRICLCYLVRDEKKAWEYAKRAVKISKDQPEILLWASTIAHRVGKSEEGSVYLHRVMTEYPDQKFLVTKSLSEVMELLRNANEEAQKRLKKLYDGEMPSHIFVDSEPNMTYAEFFYEQWDASNMVPMEFGAHCYRDDQIDLGINKVVLDYSTCLFLHELNLLELLFNEMNTIYIAGDLLGIMSEEIRDIPEMQPDIIISRYNLVQKCKNDYHIEFVEVKNPELNLDMLDALKQVEAIKAYTANYYGALWVSEDKEEGIIRANEVIVALYRKGKISQEAFDKYCAKENDISEEHVQILLQDSPKLMLDEEVISKWEEFSILSTVVSNFKIVIEATIEQSAEIGMQQLKSKKHICEKVEQLKAVLQKYNAQGKIAFIPMERQGKSVYSNMLKTVMIAAEKKGVILCVDDRVITSYSHIGNMQIYNSFDIMKMMYLKRQIILEKYVEKWKIMLNKKVRYALPDNHVLLHALTLSDIDLDSKVLRESELLRTIRINVVEALSEKSLLSTKQIGHIYIPEREYFIFQLHINSNELLRMVWMSEMADIQKWITSNWILRHYSQFAFDFGDRINDKGRMASHAVQLADFLITGLLLAHDDMQIIGYYEWLYNWIELYLKQNPDIKEKTLNYAREFIGSFLRDNSNSRTPKEFEAINIMFATGIHYMPEEFREQMLKDSTISHAFNSVYNERNVVLTAERQIPESKFQLWEREVLALCEKETLVKSFDGISFQLSWEYILPAFVGVVVRWREGSKSCEKRLLLDWGVRLKHENRNVRNDELQHIEKYLGPKELSKAKLELSHIHKYEQAANKILAFLDLSKEYEQIRIKKSLEQNWIFSLDMRKDLLPSNSGFFIQLYNYNMGNATINESVAATVPIDLEKIQENKVCNHNPVRLLHRLGWLLKSGGDDASIISAVSVLIKYVDSTDNIYGKAYILLLKISMHLLENMDSYKGEKVENLYMWAYIWTDMIMTELSEMVAEGRLDIEDFITKIQESMSISYELNWFWDDVTKADILLPYYMNLYRLCVTGTLSLCWHYKEQISHLLRDIFHMLNNCHERWLEVATHILEAELYHKDETNIYQSIFNENVYDLIGRLANYCDCNDIFPNSVEYGAGDGRRNYLLHKILEREILGKGELFYLVIISKEDLPKEDMTLLQKIIEKLERQDVIVEKYWYTCLMHIANRFPFEVQEDLVQHEMARIGKLLRERSVKWTEAETIVEEIANYKGIDKYLDFWEEYKDALDSEAALLLAEEIGQMQYCVPYEYARRMRNLRICLELAGM